MFPLYDTVRSRRFPIINWMLVLLNGLVFYYELTLGETELHRFILDWGLVPAQLALDSTESWLRILSSMFLHGGWFHIISNMWILIIFGDNIEDRMGSMRYLIFYLLSGTAAALMQAFLYPTSNIPMVGASGAIAGVLGAYLVLYPRARIASIVPIVFIFTIIELPALIFLGFWFVSQLFQGWLALGGADMSGVAWWAHIGGFVFGLLMVRLFARRRY
ncbi:MAG: rhomboid family intramembrane serine protease [Anaerolineales bacterium]|nr:MAG: rhomboid family intramembrane serine protease [Anaerolineales bacterium]